MRAAGAIESEASPRAVARDVIIFHRVKNLLLADERKDHEND